MPYIFLLFFLLPISRLSLAHDQPPSGFSALFPFFAETALMRAHNNWLKKNSQHTEGDISCTRSPLETVFFCQTKVDKNNFFCAAASTIDREKLKDVAEGKVFHFDGLATKKLRILCEGDDWFCEQWAKEPNQCWSRRAYEKKVPLKTNRTASAADRACMEREEARNFISRFLPGEDSVQKLQYLAAGDDRPAAIFIRALCRDLAKTHGYK